MGKRQPNKWIGLSCIACYNYFIMKSFEVLRDVIHKRGVKAVASDLRVSTSLVYKWCQNADGEDAAGADNPLDRLIRICESTESKDPVVWLCERVGGFLVETPMVTKETMPVVSATQKMLTEFSEMLAAVSESVADDGKIDATEAKRIREEWEDLKRQAESFVVACEEGSYNLSQEPDH